MPLGISVKMTIKSAASGLYAERSPHELKRSSCFFSAAAAINGDSGKSLQEIRPALAAAAGRIFRSTASTLCPPRGGAENRGGEK